MELQAERRAETERLVLGGRGTCERLRTFGQGDHVVMPVQHVDAFVPHGEEVVFVGAFDGSESDFRLFA